MITTKIYFNSVISTPGARFATIGVKDFYLNMSMPLTVYMRLVKLSDTPDEIIKLYNLLAKVDRNSLVYARVEKGQCKCMAI